MGVPPQLASTSHNCGNFETPPRRIPPSAVPRQWKPPQGPRRSRNLLPIQCWPSKIWAHFLPNVTGLGQKNGRTDQNLPQRCLRSLWLMFTFELALKYQAFDQPTGIHTVTMSLATVQFLPQKWGSGRNGRGSSPTLCIFLAWQNDRFLTAGIQISQTNLCERKETQSPKVW